MSMMFLSDFKPFTEDHKLVKIHELYFALYFFKYFVFVALVVETAIVIVDDL